MMGVDRRGLRSAHLLYETLIHDAVGGKAEYVLESSLPDRGGFSTGTPGQKGNTHHNALDRLIPEIQHTLDDGYLCERGSGAEMISPSTPDRRQPTSRNVPA